MDKNLHDIQNLFKIALEDNEENPSQNAWDGIEKKLDKYNVVSIKKKYNLLKKVAFLLVFLLTALSIYVWKIEDKNPIKLSNTISGINKEIKTKNDSLTQESAAINLQKGVDSLSLNASKNLQRIREDSSKIIGNAIVRSEKVDPKKPLNSLATKDPINTKINYKKSNGSLLPNASKFSIQKRSASIKVKSNDVVIASDFQFDNNLPVTGSLSSQDFGNTKINTKQIFTAKGWLQNIALSEINPSIQIEKTIIRKPFIKSMNHSVFAVTAFYSPVISFYHFKNASPGTSSNSDFGKSETESYSSTLGALIEYTIGKYWELQSGVTLTTSNFDLESGTLYAQRDNSGTIKYKLATSLGEAFVKPSFSNNPNIGDSIFSTSTSHTLQYLGIPLSVKYNLYKGKFTLNAIGGVSANFLTRGRVTTELKSGYEKERETADNINGLKQFYFSGLAGVGVDYNFYNKLSLTFSPTLQFALNSINKDVSVKSFPNSIGFLTGLKIKL